MAIKLIQGTHLTATNKRHMAAILAKGWQKGESARLAYQLEPIDGAAGQYRYTIGQMETDIWGRPQYCLRKGVIQAI